MNKKQLTLQNSSLFAELERKAKEIEILNIRLADTEKKHNILTAKNQELSASLEMANSKIKELETAVEELEKNLEDSKSTIEMLENSVSTSTEETKPAETAFSQEKSTSTTAEEILDRFFENNSGDEEAAENTETTEDAEDVTETPVDSLPENAVVSEFAQPQIQEDTKIIDDHFTTHTPNPTYATESSLPTDDLLRDYGAKIIGKVTRVTAEVLSKVNAINDDVSASLKTLALGKNESFKYQIMELAKQKGNHEKIMSEMDFLADEAIVYLRSI